MTVCVLILYAYFKFTIRNIPCAVSRDYVIGIRVSIIGERAKRVRHPLLLPIEKKSLGISTSKPQCACSQILREADEWTRVHLREACLLFASVITKSSLYVRQNDKAHAHQITLLSLAP